MKAIVKHMEKMYAALLAESNEEIIESKVLNVYRGRISHLFSQQGIGAGYYSDIFKALEAMGSISYIQRGSRGVESVIVCHYPPDPDAYEARPKPDLTGAEEFANLMETVKLTEKLVGGIDIGRVMVDFERRLKALESKLDQAENSDNIKNNVTS